MVTITIDCPTCDCKLPDTTGCCKTLHRGVQVVTLLYLLAFTITAVVLYTPIENECKIMNEDTCKAASDRCTWPVTRECSASSPIVAVTALSGIGVCLVMIGGIAVSYVDTLSRDDLFRPRKLGDFGILLMLIVGFISYIVAPAVALSNPTMGMPIAMSALAILCDLAFALSFCCAAGA